MAPAFAVPLSTQDLITVGYIALVWGQIDFFVDEMVCFAHKFDKDQRARFLTDKMMASKVDMLASDYERLPTELHADVRRFIEVIQRTKQHRNGVFHGLWGWKAEKRSQTLRVAAYHHRMKPNPVRPEHLRKLADDLAECSLIGLKVWAQLREAPHKPTTRFVWAETERPPKWLDEPGRPFRRARNPEDRRRRARGTPPKAGPG